MKVLFSLMRSCQKGLNPNRYFSSQRINRGNSKALLAGVITLGIGTYAIKTFFPFEKHQTQETDFKEKLDLIRFRDKNLAKTCPMIFFDGTWLPEKFFPKREAFSAIENFVVCDEDVIVASFPKSGTTWVQEIISQIYCLHSQEHKSKMGLIIEERFPYLEYPYPGLKELTKMKHPRMLKTHLPYQLLPFSAINGKGKVIYIAREPKDVCVSYYHFVKLLSVIHYKGTFKEFLDNFLEGKVAYGPWPDHVLSFWEKRNNKNILFIRYEELQKNPQQVIKKIADFLNKPLKEEQLNSIAEETKFEKMKDNPLVNYSWWDDLGLRNKSESNFMRKGIVGDWKNHMSDEMAGELNKMLNSHPALAKIFNE